MDFHFLNNGLPVDAVFPDKDVEKIYLPLLRSLRDLQEKKGRRILAMLAAPPGAEKARLRLSFGNWLKIRDFRR